MERLCISYLISPNRLIWDIRQCWCSFTKVYSEPYQRSMIELFGKIVNGLKMFDKVSVDTGRKLNVHKTFTRHSGRSQDVRPVSSRL